MDEDGSAVVDVVDTGPSQADLGNSIVQESLGQQIVAGAQQEFLGRQIVQNTPQPVISVPVAGSAPGLTLPGGFRVTLPTYTTPGIVVDPNVLLRQAGIIPAATGAVKVGPFGASLTTSTLETFLIAALIALGIYAVVKF